MHTENIGIEKTEDGRLNVGSIRGVPDIANAEIGEIAAWYLGPRAENAKLFRKMIEYAVNSTVNYRQRFERDDPQVITDALRKTPEYEHAVEAMLEAYKDLVDYLQDYATPYFSMRYQGHMLRDNTLPALCAYFAAMLHNPNNVTIQASSATTPLEILVGLDLCAMVGFPVSTDKQKQQATSWAHITCDGTVANLEACWALREAKFFPFAVRQMLESAKRFTLGDHPDQQHEIPIDNAQKPISVKCGNGHIICLTANNIDPWLLFNVSLEEILSLPAKIAAVYGIDDEFVVWSAAVPYTLNYLGWIQMDAYLTSLSGDSNLPVVIIPATTHYSLPKSAALLGYGFGASGPGMDNIPPGNIITVGVDTNGRINLAELEHILSTCLKEKIPITQIVGIVGTTEEGSVDPLSDILQLRENFRLKGLDFFIHADSAWGGYMISSIRKPYKFTYDKEDYGDACSSPNTPSTPFVDRQDSPLNDYVYDQYCSLRRCDSITIDPHKMGYIQYPAGAILYRNGQLRRLTTFTGAYIGGTGSINPGSEPTTGIFGVEGSKPGASSAAVFMNHRVIRPDITGHGKIIRQSMINTKLFALYLLALGDTSDHFQVTLLTSNDNPGQRFKEGAIFKMEQKEIIAIIESCDLRNFGPDLNILDYVFTPLNENGQPIYDLTQLNRFNKAIYDAFHVPVTEARGKKLPIPIEEFPKLFITMTTFRKAEYGTLFLESFFKRICRGDDTSPIPEINELVCLRSVVMDPFMPYTRDGFFFRDLMRQLAETIDQLVRELRRSPPHL